MMLRRAVFRFVSGRPVHPRADAERQRAFVAGFEELLTSTLIAEALGGPVEIGFQDEARVGRKGMTTRVCSTGKQRPRPSPWPRLSVRRHLRGVGIAHVADKANTASMNEHLAVIGAAVARVRTAWSSWTGQAGIARATFPLPPPRRSCVCRPELKSTEQIILFLKSIRFANRVFTDVAALREACWAGCIGSPTSPTSSRRRSGAAGSSRHRADPDASM